MSTVPASEGGARDETGVVATIRIVPHAEVRPKSKINRLPLNGPDILVADGVRTEMPALAAALRLVDPC